MENSALKPPLLNPTTETLAPILALFIGVGILLVGNGLQSTLLAVRGTAEGFTANNLGFVQSSYFIGFIAGSILSVRMIERAGHIRAFSALASVASAAALAHLMVIDPIAWILIRVITGFCFAGLYVAIESWLNTVAANEVRGQVFSIYMVVNLLALSAGQLLLTTADPGGFVLFCLVSIIISMALVPIAMTRAVAPSLTKAKWTPIAKLYSVSPLGVVGCCLYGVAMSAFWGLAPVFAQRVGLGHEQIGYFMSVTIIGGLLLQWPIGRTSDHFDRRKMIAAMALLAAAVAAAMAWFGKEAGYSFLVLAALFGGAAFPIYSLTIAHVNDFIAREEMVSVSSALLIVYGAGAIIGPSLAGGMMRLAGAAGLYFFIAIVFAGVGAFSVFRMTRRGPAPVETHETFTPASASTAQSLQMDPRSEIAPD